ncbi:MAG TPA: SMP-30/gluconolactonase/LRE family protein [Alloacidobacterium sp.]|nr:SMP-30/gluconolactonase/LRE family protein [Alloacidobacterium sp.]
MSRDAKLETMATGFGFTEGPVWDRSGFLWVSDEELNKIFRVYPDGHHEEMVALGDPDGSTFDHEHRLINTASVLRALIRLSKDGKSFTVLTDRYEGKKFNSPNDVVLGPDGAFYFTDPTLDLPKGEKQEIPFQGVYRLDATGKVTLLTKDLTQPNGLAFSPDGKRLYIDDTEKKNIRVYDFHPNGTISNGRIFGNEDDGTKDGVPDGIRIDQNGNLFVVGPRGIWVWSPEGVHLGTIEVPEQPANLSWGGADNSTLYITATTSIYTIPTKTRGFVPYD